MYSFLLTNQCLIFNNFSLLMHFKENPHPNVKVWSFACYIHNIDNKKRYFRIYLTFYENLPDCLKA